METYGLIDNSKQEKKNKKLEQRRIRELNDIKKVLSFVEGRRLLWRILGETGLYKSSFTGNSNTFYLEGKRAIGLFLISEMMESRPEAFAQMQQEFHSERKSQEMLDKIEEEKERISS